MGSLSVEALAGDERDPEVLSRRLDLVLRYYLRDVDAGRATRPFPHGLGVEEADRTTVVEARLDGDLWHAFVEEAERQGVRAAALVAHSIFYFTADAESGLVTERIVRDLEEVES